MHYVKAGKIVCRPHLDRAKFEATERYGLVTCMKCISRLKAANHMQRVRESDKRPGAGK